MHGWTLIEKLFTTGAITSAVTVGIMRLLGQRWIERYRTELQTRERVLESALGASVAGHMVAQERRLKGVETIWAEVMRIREAAGRYLFIYNLMLENEYDDALPGRGRAEVIPAEAWENFVEKERCAQGEIEQNRPFVGERLWTYFFIYRAFNMRLVMKTLYGRGKGHIHPWYADMQGRPDSHKRVWAAVLNEVEIGEALKRPTGGPQYVIGLMEQKILHEIDVLISGRSVADLSVAESQRLADALQSAEKAVKA